MARRAPLSTRFARQGYWSGFPVFHFLLKGVSQTQGLSPTSWLAGGLSTTQPLGSWGGGGFRILGFLLRVGWGLYWFPGLRSPRKGAAVGH